jgi:hypothetical protein
MGSYRGVTASAEAICGLLVLVLGAAAYMAVPSLVSGWAFAMPGTTDNALSPTFFPRVLLVVMMISAAVVIISAPRRKEDIPLASTGGLEFGRTAILAVLLIAYFAGLGVLGFILSSIAFMVAVTFLLGFKRPVLAIGFAIAVSLITALLFRYGMNVLLPAGLFGLGF